MTPPTQTPNYYNDPHQQTYTPPSITPTLDTYQTTLEVSSISSVSSASGSNSDNEDDVGLRGYRGKVDGKEVERRIEELLTDEGYYGGYGSGVGVGRNVGMGRRSFSVGGWGGGMRKKKDVGVIGGVMFGNGHLGQGVVMMDDKVALDEFKVRKCPDAEQCVLQGLVGECPYWHDDGDKRRKPSLRRYRPVLCRFGGECRKGDMCSYSHNDFERRYHPGRWRQETCRDFIRGDCPRRYCTFKHEVSAKVENALREIYRMDDKEMLQFVLKIEEIKGRPLHEKMMRRFCGAGHRKHSGWKLEGCDDGQVRYLMGRVGGIKRRLKVGGETRWANLIRVTGLRDMMSGVRKVTEEIRETLKRGMDKGEDANKMIRMVFSNTNWSCHSQEGANPFIVTPTNQNDALTSLENLVEHVIAAKQAAVSTMPLQVNTTGNINADMMENRMLYPGHNNMASKVAVANWA